jgi:hypothetical protein
MTLIWEPSILFARESPAFAQGYGAAGANLRESKLARQTRDWKFSTDRESQILLPNPHHPRNPWSNLIHLPYSRNSRVTKCFERMRPGFQIRR